MSRKLTREKLELLKGAGYSGRAIELYVNKVNVGLIENPDVALAYTGPCGDTIKLYLKMNKNKVIEDAKFQYFGSFSGRALWCPRKGRCRQEPHQDYQLSQR